MYLFNDYENTKTIYHIISLYDLKSTLLKGIHYDDKVTYNTKYNGFHSTIQKEKTKNIPKWLKRDKAIFASMNYNKNNNFYADSVVLSIKINPEKCWVANENLVNKVYAPFILKEIDGYKKAEHFMKTKGKKLLKEYWETSLSFLDNLNYRFDLKEDYNAEVLILHSVLPKDIKVEYIIAGHTKVKPEEWKEKFC